MKPHRGNRQFDKVSIYRCTRRPGGTGGRPMTRDHQLRQLVSQAQQRLQETLHDAEVLVMDLANIHKMLSASATSDRTITTTPTSDPSTRIAITNGRRLCDGDVQSLNEEEYDLVLDTKHSTLRYRKSPEQQSQLMPSDLSGIGSYRIQIITFMIEHFGVPVCAENTLDSDRIATWQAFTKTISMLRKALGGRGRRNPYIQSVPAWESSRSNNACAYVLNPQWRYLLIRHKKI